MIKKKRIINTPKYNKWFINFFFNKVYFKNGKNSSGRFFLIPTIEVDYLKDDDFFHDTKLTKWKIGVRFLQYFVGTLVIRETFFDRG
jgi:hypothetical protein